MMINIETIAGADPGIYKKGGTLFYNFRREL